MSASSGGFPSPEQPAPPDGSFRIYQVTLTKLNGNLLSDTRTYSGTLEVLQSAARSTLRHNLLSGWWGLPGLVGTPLVLLLNAKAMRQIRVLEARAARGGPDPSQRNRPAGVAVPGRRRLWSRHATRGPDGSLGSARPGALDAILG
jgi:hypothetical protein